MKTERNHSPLGVKHPLPKQKPTVHKFIKADEQREAALQCWMADEKNLPPIIELSELDESKTDLDSFRKSSSKQPEISPLVTANESFMDYKLNRLEPHLNRLKNNDIRTMMQDYVNRSPHIYLRAINYPLQTEQDFKRFIDQTNAKYDASFKLDKTKAQANVEEQIELDRGRVQDLRAQGKLCIWA